MTELKKPEESELWASDPAGYQCALKEYERACKELALEALRVTVRRLEYFHKPGTVGYMWADDAREALAKIQDSEK
jgi:hypothetical protein